ncbi:MAG TPA: hypothetical protein VJN21_10565 [Candidatus Acidoferrales bacterium]|nr:hypothetical protein [Candidatus Acidoferrales bacterium]
MPKLTQNQQATSQSRSSHANQPQPGSKTPPDPNEVLAARFAQRIAQIDPEFFSRTSAIGPGTRGAKKPLPSTVAQARNYLRAARSPKFLRSAPDLKRHSRKCAICRHPEREMIEELFIHWHSPHSIVRFIDDVYEDDGEMNWVAIYRHAYAFGLDDIRRRNLRHFFENILDDCGDATPTIAGVLAAARALGCVTEDGRWVEPEKRILMTTVVRKDDSSSTTATGADSADFTASQPDDSAQNLSFRERSAGRDSASMSLRANLRAGSSNEDTNCVSISSLPEAASHNPARSAEQVGSRSTVHKRAKPAQNLSFRERLEGRRSSSTPLRATPGSFSPSEKPVALPSSLLPQAAVEAPADACPERHRGAQQTPPPGAPSASTGHEPPASSSSGAQRGSRTTGHGSRRTNSGPRAPRSKLDLRATH